MLYKSFTSLVEAELFKHKNRLSLSGNGEMKREGHAAKQITADFKLNRVDSVG